MPVSPPVANPLWWLDASQSVLNAGGTQCTNGQAVANWVDMSGNGFSAVQATVAHQPLFATNQIHGQSAIHFQGNMPGAVVNALTQTAVATAAQPFTIFCLAIINGNNGNSSADFLYDGANAVGANRNILTLSTANQLTFAAGANLPFTWTRAQQAATHLYEGLFNGASSQAWVDGVSQGTGNTGTQLQVALTVGNNRAVNAAGAFNGYIAEMLVYGTLTTLQRTTIERYFMVKYGLIPGLGGGRSWWIYDEE